MLLSIREVAGILKLSEKSVRNLIASGKLIAERVGRRILVRQELLESFMDDNGVKKFTSAEEESSANRDCSTVSKGLEDVVERLTMLEGQLHELSLLLHKNNACFQELREKDALIALKESESEKLRRDILYQQRICEKEMEHCRKQYEAQCALLRDEFAEKLALERHHHEEKLAGEKALWSERLMSEQESFNLKLLHVKDREGLWAKLVKMMTWT
jgi:excisionase family DNA binding protein